MPTQARRNKRIDVQRIGLAVSHAGIDPRTWVSAARIDDSPDAAEFLTGNGWVVDATFYGSDLDGESEVPMRLISSLAGNGYGEYIPPSAGCEAVVAVLDGDPESNPVVIGYLTNSDDCKPPTEINGLVINADLEASIPKISVSPADTEFKRSPHNRREQYEQDWTVQAVTATLRGDDAVVLQSKKVQLGSDGATEPGMLGETTNGNLESLLTALDTLAGKLAALTGPLAAFQAIGTTLAADLVPIRAKLPSQLSKVVTLD